MPADHFRFKLSRYGLSQIKFMKQTFNRQTERGTVTYFRCCRHKKGCKARLSLKSGVLLMRANTTHNHD